MLIGMVACGGGDTEIEVIQEPEVVEPEPVLEPVEKPIQKPKPDLRYFGTLESWGAEEGLIDLATDNAGNCVDSLLTTEQNFPVPFPRESLAKRVNGVDILDNANILKGDTSCREGFFKRIARIGKWSIKPLSEIVFVKTHRGNNVVGGIIHFNYNTDSQEYRDRQELWDKCEEGTDPSEESMELGRESRGRWVATKENEFYRFCIRLNTLPGSVKCLHREYLGRTEQRNELYLYKNGRPVKMLVTNDDFISKGTSSTGFTLFNQRYSQVDFPNSDRICGMWDEGLYVLGPLECTSVIKQIRCDFADPDPDCQPSEDDPFGTYKEAEVLECKREEI